MKLLATIHRWALIAALWWGCGGTAFAQEAAVRTPEQRIYDFFLKNQGDSLYEALSPTARQKVARNQCQDLFPMLEKQFGRLQRAGAWQKDSLPGILLKYRDLQFERYPLRLQFSFGPTGQLEGFWVKPVPAPSTAKPLAYDASKMEEREMLVGADGFKLPATLTLPKGMAPGGRVPCVVLVHGSGPNDRDETVGPNKPFRDLAWGLAARGIATLRYEKRTYVYRGECVPAGRELDYDTEAVDDAVAAVKQLAARPELSPDSLFLLGHSLGGTLAPRIAERAPELAGLILLSGLARPFEDALLEQTAYLFSLAGAPADADARQEALRKQVANVKKLGTDAFNDSISLPLGLPQSYWQMAIAYKPVEVAARLQLPILVLQGERDYQVTMEDFGLWRSGLFRSKQACFKSYPRLNHLMQEGSGKGTPFEYQHASPVPAYVMDDVASFVHGKRNQF